MKPSFLAFIIEYGEKLNQKGSQKILNPLGPSYWHLLDSSFTVGVVIGRYLTQNKPPNYIQHPIPTLCKYLHPDNRKELAD